MEAQKTHKIVSFVGGHTGEWKVAEIVPVIGSTLATPNYLSIHKEDLSLETEQASDWVLKGFASNLRYTTREEKNILDVNPSVLGKIENQFAVMIPIKKKETWWAMTQDERRKILEENSRHIEIGSKYLTSINRQLYHSRDLGEVFDFITWFEFSEENKSKFDELLAALRKTEEWSYVEREVEVRLMKII